MHQRDVIAALQDPYADEVDCGYDGGLSARMVTVANRDPLRPRHPSKMWAFSICHAPTLVKYQKRCAEHGAWMLPRWLRRVVAHGLKRRRAPVREDGALR